MMYKITIIVLDWNGGEDTIKCLDSLEKIEDNNFNVLVVDNNSKIKPTDYLKIKFPDFKYLELNKNYGYSLGNNIGFEHIKDDCDFVCFLNNDVVVSHDFISNFREAIDKYGENNIYGPKIFFEYPSKIIWYGGGVVDLKKGLIFHKNLGKKDDRILIKEEFTNYVTGCCLLISTENFQKLNGFDSRFNMYAEDVDLCLRAKKHEIKSVFIPTAVIWHKVSSSLGGRYSIKKYQKKFKSIKKLLKIHEPNLNSTFYTIKSVLNIILPKN